MKKLLHKLLRDRRGISMTEVIVAMAVVTIVTAAAISVVMASIKFDAKYNDETTALSYCESVVDCVRFADDVDTLSKALDTVKPGFGSYSQEETGQGHEFLINEAGAVIKVVVTTIDENVNYVVTYDDDEIYAITKPKT